MTPFPKSSFHKLGVDNRGGSNGGVGFTHSCLRPNDDNDVNPLEMLVSFVLPPYRPLHEVLEAHINRFPFFFFYFTILLLFSLHLLFYTTTLPQHIPSSLRFIFLVKAGSQAGVRSHRHRHPQRYSCQEMRVHVKQQFFLQLIKVVV